MYARTYDRSISGWFCGVWVDCKASDKTSNAVRKFHDSSRVVIQSFCSSLSMSMSISMSIKIYTDELDSLLHEREGTRCQGRKVAWAICWACRLEFRLLPKLIKISCLFFSRDNTNKKRTNEKDATALIETRPHPHLFTLRRTRSNLLHTCGLTGEFTRSKKWNPWVGMVGYTKNIRVYHTGKPYLNLTSLVAPVSEESWFREALRSSSGISSWRSSESSSFSSSSSSLFSASFSTSLWRFNTVSQRLPKLYIRSHESDSVACPKCCHPLCFLSVIHSIVV